MRPQHYVMTSEKVYHHAANLLQTQLQWVDHGRKCTAKTILLVLFYAAGQLCSLAMACQRLRTAPSDQPRGLATRPGRETAAKPGSAG